MPESDHQMLSLFGAILALVISLVTLVRERKLHRRNEELQKSQVGLQREANRLQQATDALAKRQLELIEKLEHEPYFALKWKKLSPALHKLIVDVRRWIDRAETDETLRARMAIPVIAERVPYQEIDWSYSPAMKQSLQLLEVRLQALERDSVEHCKLFLMGNDGFWLTRRLWAQRPLENGEDEEFFGVFGSALGMRQFFDDLLVRLQLDGMPDDPRVIRNSPHYQRILAESASHMREQLRHASALAQQLQKAADVYDGKFGVPLAG